MTTDQEANALLHRAQEIRAGVNIDAAGVYVAWKKWDRAVEDWTLRATEAAIAKAAE